MNERIKELYLQAHEQHYSNNMAWEEVNYEKFAELIVRECAELIDNKETITAAQTYDEVFVAKFDTKELCAKQIIEHFGIKE